MAAKSDYYDILGISKSASADEIKKAYRKQALEWHPDRHKSEKEVAEKRFKEINEAYQVLSDSQKRSAYDQFGHQAFTPGGGFPQGGFPGGGPFGQSGRYGPFTYTYSSSGSEGGSPFSGFDFGDPFEIFEQFFGGATPFRQERRLPRYSLTLDFMEAVFGTTKEVVTGGEKRTLKIPAGINEGAQINFSDFILSVNIKPHPVFEREGDDVYVQVTLPFSVLILGGEIKVPTLEGDLKIRIRPGTQAGTMIRLKEKGVKRLHGPGRGDEYLKVNVLIPGKISHEQKKLIEELKKREL